MRDDVAAEEVFDRRTGVEFPRPDSGRVGGEVSQAEYGVLNTIAPLTADARLFEQLAV